MVKEKVRVNVVSEIVRGHMAYLYNFATTYLCL